MSTCGVLLWILIHSSPADRNRHTIRTNPTGTSVPEQGAPFSYLPAMRKQPILLRIPPHTRGITLRFHEQPPAPATTLRQLSVTAILGNPQRHLFPSLALLLSPTTPLSDTLGRNLRPFQRAPCTANPSICSHHRLACHIR
jgi:hypothetical protein